MPETRKRENMRTKKTGLTKILAAVLAVVLACTVGALGYVGSKSAPESSAAQNTIPATGELMTGEPVDLGGASMNLLTISGQPAYSLAPARAVPASGEYALAVPNFQSAQSLMKTIMWTSYGAPGFDESLYPSTYFDGTPMTAEKYQVATYIMTANSCGLGWGDPTEGASAEFKAWADGNVMGTTLDKVKERLFYTPSNFALVEVDAGYPQAPVLSFVPGGFAKVEASSAASLVTDGNMLYSLEDAAWRVYDNESCSGSPLGEFVANGNGATNSVYLSVGTYYVKQSSASAGYALSDEVSAIEVGNGSDTALSVSTVPVVDSDPLVILKRDANHAATDKGDVPQGGASLANAQYTVSYFDASLSSVAAAQAATPKWSKTLTVSWGGTSATASPTASDLLNNSVTAGWPLGSYLVSEAQAPQAGYFVDASAPYLVSVTKDGSSSAQSKVVVGETSGSRNAPISADNALVSTERVFSGDISVVRYTNGPGTTGQVPAVGVRYEIVNDSDYPVMNPETGAWVAKGGIVGTITTNDQGYASTKQLGNNTGNVGRLAYGTYTLREIASTLPAGTATVGSLSTSIMVNGQNRFFTLDESAGAFVRVNKVDKSQKDAGTNSLVPGTTQFRILDASGTPVAFNDEFPVTNKLTTLTVDADGRLVLPSKLAAGTYSLEEVRAPYGYQRASSPIAFTIPASAATTTSYATPYDVYLPDENAWGQISITNRDQGHNLDITGSSATYQVVAADDIYTADGTKRVDAGEVVDTVTTSNGKAVTKNLYLGNYIVKQTATPEGYVADTNEYPISLVYVDDTTSPVTVSKLLYNKAVYGHIDANKVDATSKKVVPSAGTVFEIKAAENIVGKDGYNFYVAGDVVDTVVTGADGYANGSKPLPLGKYQIVEHTAPYPYILNDAPTAVELSYVDDKTPVVSGNGAVEDERATTVFRASKLDRETGKLVTTPNTQIGVYAAEDIVMPEGSIVFSKDELVDTITTDATGYGTGTVKAAVGNYYMKEISAPEGYVLDSETRHPVAFTYPGQDAADSVTDGTVSDIAQKGTITFTKHDAETGKLIPVAGIVAEIYANEDIVTGDGTVRAQKDELVDTITTSSDGVVTSKELYLGSYRVVETQAPEGYLLNSEPTTVVLSYQGQNVDVFSKPGQIADDNVKGIIEVTKIDKETGKIVPVAGTTFEVVAKNDITTPDGTVRVSAGEAACAPILTDDTGKASTPQLYLGTYTIRETKAPAGYVLSTEEIDAQLVWKDQVTAVVSASSTYANTVQKGIINIEKLDAESDKAVLRPGAVFEVVAAESIVTPDGTQRASAGEVVDTVTTDETGKASTKALYLGDYTVREAKAPIDYLLADATASVSLEYGEPTEPLVYENTTLTDQVVKGTLSLSVMDSRNKECQLADTEWDVIATEDIVTADGIVHVKKGEVATSIKTTASGMARTEELYLGKYELVQTSQVDGYQRDLEPHPFVLEYADDKTPVVNVDMTLYNKPTDFSFTKVGDDGNMLTDTQFVAWEDVNASDFSGIAVYSPYEILTANVVYTSALDNMSGDFEQEVQLSKNDGVSKDYNVYTSGTAPEKGNYKLHVEYRNEESEFSIDEKFTVNESDASAIFFVGELGSDPDMQNAMSVPAASDAPEGGNEAEEPAQGIPAALADDVNGGETGDESDTPAAPGVENHPEGTEPDGSDNDQDKDGNDSEPDRSELLTAPSGILHRVPVVLNTGTFAVSAADEEGVVEFRYVPQGKASFAESKALNGFATDRSVSTIEVDGKGYVADEKSLAPSATVVDDGSVIITNSAIKVTVSKTASETGTELPGNALAVFAVADDGTETLVDSWVTGTEPHIMSEVKAGDYVLKEEMPAEGYSVAEPIYFRVNDTASEQAVSMENTMIPVIEDVMGQLGDAFPFMLVAGAAMLVAGIFGYSRYRTRKNA